MIQGGVAEGDLEHDFTRTQDHLSTRCGVYPKLSGLLPVSAEARPALVSMGRLFLGPLGNLREALKVFDGYLSMTRRGTLAQEVSYGRIQAFRALGKSKEEFKALQSFLRRFPGAIQTESVKRRLEKIKKSSSEPMSHRASPGSEDEGVKVTGPTQKRGKGGRMQSLVQLPG